MTRICHVKYLPKKQKHYLSWQFCGTFLLFSVVLCCFQKCNSYKIIEILRKVYVWSGLRRCKVGSKSPMIYMV